jgi:hypothetical protein
MKARMEAIVLAWSSMIRDREKAARVACTEEEADVDEDGDDDDDSFQDLDPAVQTLGRRTRPLRRRGEPQQPPPGSPYRIQAGGRRQLVQRMAVLLHQ